MEELLKKPQVWADLKALSDAGLAMDFGGGAKEVQQLLQITDRIPDLRIVINHLPGARVPDDPASAPPGRRDTRELAKRPHIYVKFSEIFQRVDERGHRVQTGGRIPKDLAFYKPRLDEIYETFGPDRLMFASDWTNSEPMSTFGELVALDHEYFSPKGREVMEKVFWKNSLCGLSLEEAARQPAQPGLTRQRIKTEAERCPRHDEEHCRRTDIAALSGFAGHGANAGSDLPPHKSSSTAPARDAMAKAAPAATGRPR